MSILRVSSKYEGEFGKPIEDGHFARPESPFAMVCDALSEPHSPAHPQRLCSGKTSGEQVRQVIVDAFDTTCDDEDLLDNIKYVDTEVKREVTADFKTDTQGLLPGACFAATKISVVGDTMVLDYVVAGDCRVIIKTRDEIMVTPNKARNHEAKMVATIKRLMEEIAQEQGVNLRKATREDLWLIRAEMWDRFYHELVRARSEVFNNPADPDGFAILNGALNLDMLVTGSTGSIRVADFRFVLLLTDGMWPVNYKIGEPVTDEYIATFPCNDYESGGLEAVLKTAQHIERLRNQTNTTHQSIAEKTAVAIELV